MDFDPEEIERLPWIKFYLVVDDHLFSFATEGILWVKFRGILVMWKDHSSRPVTYSWGGIQHHELQYHEMLFILM